MTELDPLRLNAAYQLTLAIRHVVDRDATDACRHGAVAALELIADYAIAKATAQTLQPNQERSHDHP